MTVFEKIQEIIVDQLDKTKEEVTLETSIQGDLEADSLDLFQVINDIEEAFDVTIDTDETFETVGDLVAFVEKSQK